MRTLAVELARRDVREDLQELQRALPELGEEMATRRREQVMAKLRRLAPGRAAAVSAVMNQAGQIVTDPSEIADALRSYFPESTWTCTLRSAVTGRT